MIFLVLIACALAVASADSFYPGSQHHPVIGANGVPIDTPEVQHATAQHFAHKVEAEARSSDHVAPYVAHPSFYSAYYGYPAVSPAGVPLDTPEVSAEKAKHFAAHSEALARSGHYYRARRDIYVPSTYTATYHHTPAVAHTAYTYPYGHLYRARRDLVSYGAYPHSYAYSGYNAYPYAHYY